MGIVWVGVDYTCLLWANRHRKKAKEKRRETTNGLRFLRTPGNNFGRDITRHYGTKGQAFSRANEGRIREEIKRSIQMQKTQRLCFTQKRSIYGIATPFLHRLNIEKSWQMRAKVSKNSGVKKHDRCQTKVTTKIRGPQMVTSLNSKNSCNLAKKEEKRMRVEEMRLAAENKRRANKTSTGVCVAGTGPSQLGLDDHSKTIIGGNRPSLYPGSVRRFSFQDLCHKIVYGN